MEKLKVGDRVYMVAASYCLTRRTYIFSEVERVTNITAVLKNGDKLLNEPKRLTLNGKTEYTFHQMPHNTYASWKLVTQEVLDKYNAYLKQEAIDMWFSSYKFSDKQKETIYDMFKDEQKPE